MRKPSVPGPKHAGGWSAAALAAGGGGGFFGGGGGGFGGFVGHGGGVQLELAGAGGGGFEADAAQGARAVVLQEGVGGFFEVEVAAFLTVAATGGDAFDDADAVHAFRLEAVAGGQQLRIALQQHLGQVDRHFFFDQGVRADRVAGGQHQAVAGQRDFRPQHAGGVDQDDVLAEIKLLLDLGDGRLVTHLGHLFLQQGVHEGRFAHVRNAHDHDAQGLGGHAPVRRQRQAQGRNAGHVGR